MCVDSGDGQLTLELTLQADWALPASVSERRLQSLVAFALRQEGASGQWEINLLFTTDARIQAMHRDFMNLDSPTDIMTFPYEADEFTPSEASNRGGDIVISVEAAALHAEEAGWSLTNELRFLTLHGLLHILGWDDADPGQRASMLA
ncbi:MAG: rRNA maturation RNase YbeY, partial [Chloroflexota bacterium]|nr:rRNA maturation RNase YbeY [Chloroflexota bacterium]